MARLKTAGRKYNTPKKARINTITVPVGWALNTNN